MNKNKFSARLAELLGAIDDNMRDFAQKCDVPYSTIRGYITGESVPAGIEQVLKIARAIGVRASWLLGEESIPEQPDISSTERDLQLMTILAEQLTDIQREVFIKKMLDALLHQVEGIERFERFEPDDVKNLPTSIIGMALEFHRLPEDKQTFLLLALHSDQDTTC